MRKFNFILPRLYLHGRVKMIFHYQIIIFVSFLCFCHSLETDLISGETYRLTEDSCTWLEAKNRCSLAGEDIAELDESTGLLKSTANISGSENFTAWIDAYKTPPHVLLNKGCYNLQQQKFYILNGTNEPRLCAAFCPGVIYIALQGNKCYCLTADPVSNVDIDFCNGSCPGDKSKICGNTNLESMLSIYQVVHMSKDMCPCVMTETNNGGVKKYEIQLYIVNCTYINLHYLCKPTNNKNFNADVFNVYKNVYKANSSCTFGLADLYHVEYNFKIRNPQFNLGPSYYINFIRGLTSIVGDVTTSNNPVTCYAYSHSKSFGDSVVERSCSDSIAGLCQYDETTTAYMPTTTENSTTQPYWNSTDKVFTLLPVIHEYNNVSIAVLIIVIVIILSLGLTIKCLCNIIAIVRGRRSNKRQHDVVEFSDDKKSQHKTEQKGMAIYASVCKKTKTLSEHNNLAFNHEISEFEPYEIENNYNNLIRDEKQNSVSNSERLYDSTADDMYNALSWNQPGSKSIDEDTYDHTMSISQFSDSPRKQSTQMDSKLRHEETKQNDDNISKRTEYNHLEIGVTKQEDGLYDHTSDGSYNILSYTNKGSSQITDNIYDHMGSN